VEGKLSPLLLKPINQTYSTVNREYPGFYITQNNPTFYYVSDDFIYSKHKSDVFVLIKLPIGLSPTVY